MRWRKLGFEGAIAVDVGFEREVAEEREGGDQRVEALGGNQATGGEEAKRAASRCAPERFAFDHRIGDDCGGERCCENALQFAPDRLGWNGDRIGPRIIAAHREAAEGAELGFGEIGLRRGVFGNDPARRRA